MTESWPDLGNGVLEAVYARALAYAVGRMGRISWRGRRGGTAPLGVSPEDVVHETIQDIIGGIRRFDPTKTLLENICEIISSKVSNLGRSAPNTKVEICDEKVVKFEDYRDSPETTAIRKMQVEKYLQFIREIDKEAFLVAEQIIIFEMSNSNEMSIQLQISVKGIDNIKKRLKRLTRDYQLKFELTPNDLVKEKDAGDD